MFIDDGGYRGDYAHINTIEEFVIIALQSAPYFLMKPFPGRRIILCSFFKVLKIYLYLSF